MSRILTSELLNVNTNPKSNYRVKSKPNHKIWYGERGDVHKKHCIMKAAVQPLGIKRTLRTIIEELVNNSNIHGITRISYKKLANLLTCSISTVKNYLNKLQSLGLIARRKEGWQQTNTTILLPVKNELGNKEPNSDPYLNPHNSYLRSKNINHYKEYVSVSVNSQKKEEKRPPDIPPRVSGVPKQGILRAEREASRENLDQSLQNLVENEIDPRYKQTLELTLKRLRASTNEKIELVKEFAACANKFVVQNVGGLLVSRFKKMKEGKPKVVEKTRNQNTENELRTLATMKAEQSLLEMGIKDPRLSIGATYDDIKAYETRVATLFVKFLNELKSESSATVRKSPSVEEPEAKQTWADKFYS